MKSCDTNACIEVEYDGGAVVIRNSQRPRPWRTCLASREEWLAFLAGAKNGEFDNLVPAIPPEGGER